MNPLIPVSIAINAVLVLITGVSGQYPAWLALVLGAFVALSALGAALIAAGRRKPGAILAGIGCLVFAPIGLIGVFGAAKVLQGAARTA